jgi:hypothetical protein
MQRWALILSGYDYDIQYRASGKHANCDALSRLPGPGSDSTGSESEVFCVQNLDVDFPVLAEDVAKETKLNPILSKVYHYVMTGWPMHCTEEYLKPYFNRKDQLSTEQECLLWGSRVIVPLRLREKLLEELHWEHPGICSMKAIARSFCWWHKIDSDMEARVKDKILGKCLCTSGDGVLAHFSENTNMSKA